MPGLMTTSENTPQRTQGMAAEAPQPGAGPMMVGDAGGDAASPEEQQMYDEFVNKAYELVYNGNKVSPQVMEALKGDGNPVDGLANATAMVVMRTEDSATQKGRKIPGDVVFHAGTEVLEDLADLASQAGIHDFTEEEMEGAAYQALDIYRAQRQQQGSLDMGAIGQDFEQIMAAEKSGQLDQMFPGIEGYAKKAPKPEKGNA